MLPSDFTYYKSITVDHTKVGSDLSNFPVMVKLTSSNFDFSQLQQADGYDIRFFDGTDDSANALSYEVEKMDIANSEAIIWVKVPTASSASDTIFYLFWGNSSATDGSTPNDVWDSSFKAVYHFADITNIVDSTANANNADSNTKVDSSADTKIGNAVKMVAGDSDKVEIPDSDSLDFTNSFEASFWLKFNTIPSDWYCIFGKSAYDSAYGVMQNKDTTLRYYLAGLSASSMDYSWSPTAGTWYRFTLTYDGSYTKIYLGDTEVASISNSGSFNVNGYVLNLGYSSTNGYYADISLDEVRFSTYHGVDWIKASDYSEEDTLLTYGTTQNVIHYAISGQVTLNGSAVSGATVRLFNQTSGSYIGDTTTDSNGNYSFSGVSNTDYYHIFVEYTAGDGTKYNCKSLWDVQGVEES